MYTHATHTLMHWQLRIEILWSTLCYFNYLLCIILQLSASDSDGKDVEEEEDNDQDDEGNQNDQDRMFTDDPTKKSSYINLPSVTDETDPPSSPEKTAGRPNMYNK